MATRPGTTIKDDTPSQRDREDLVELLEDLESVLDDLTEHPRPAIPGRHHKSLRKAWLRTKKIRDDLRNEIMNDHSVTYLAKAGLGGDFLKFKIALCRHSRDELLDFGLAKDGDSKDLPWWQRWIPRFKSFLSSAEVVVGSLVAAFPWAEPLREFVEAAGVAVDISERFLNGE